MNSYKYLIFGLFLFLFCISVSYSFPADSDFCFCKNNKFVTGADALKGITCQTEKMMYTFFGETLSCFTGEKPKKPGQEEFPLTDEFPSNDIVDVPFCKKNNEEMKTDGDWDGIDNVDPNTKTKTNDDTRVCKIEYGDKKDKIIYGKKDKHIEIKDQDNGKTKFYDVGGAPAYIGVQDGGRPCLQKCDEFATIENDLLHSASCQDAQNNLKEVRIDVFTYYFPIAAECNSGYGNNSEVDYDKICVFTGQDKTDYVGKQYDTAGNSYLIFRYSVWNQLKPLIQSYQCSMGCDHQNLVSDWASKENPIADLLNCFSGASNPGSTNMLHSYSGQFGDFSTLSESGGVNSEAFVLLQDYPSTPNLRPCKRNTGLKTKELCKSTKKYNRVYWKLGDFGLFKISGSDNYKVGTKAGEVIAEDVPKQTIIDAIPDILNGKSLDGIFGGISKSNVPGTVESSGRTNDWKLNPEYGTIYKYSNNQNKKYTGETFIEVKNGILYGLPKETENMALGDYCYYYFKGSKRTIVERKIANFPIDCENPESCNIKNGSGNIVAKNVPRQTIIDLIPQLVGGAEPEVFCDAAHPADPQTGVCDYGVPSADSAKVSPVLGADGVGSESCEGSGSCNDSDKFTAAKKHLEDAGFDKGMIPIAYVKKDSLLLTPQGKKYEISFVVTKKISSPNGRGELIIGESSGLSVCYSLDKSEKTLEPCVNDETIEGLKGKGLGIKVDLLKIKKNQDGSIDTIYKLPIGSGTEHTEPSEIIPLNFKNCDDSCKVDYKMPDCGNTGGYDFIDLTWGETELQIENGGNNFCVYNCDSAGVCGSLGDYSKTKMIYSKKGLSPRYSQKANDLGGSIKKYSLSNGSESKKFCANCSYTQTLKKPSDFWKKNCLDASQGKLKKYGIQGSDVLYVEDPNGAISFKDKKYKIQGCVYVVDVKSDVVTNKSIGVLSNSIVVVNENELNFAAYGITSPSKNYVRGNDIMFNNGSIASDFQNNGRYMALKSMSLNKNSSCFGCIWVLDVGNKIKTKVEALKPVYIGNYGSDDITKSKAGSDDKDKKINTLKTYDVAKGGLQWDVINPPNLPLDKDYYALLVIWHYPNATMNLDYNVGIFDANSFNGAAVAYTDDLLVFKPINDLYYAIKTDMVADVYLMGQSNFDALYNTVLGKNYVGAFPPWTLFDSGSTYFDNMVIDYAHLPKQSSTGQEISKLSLPNNQIIAVKRTASMCPSYSCVALNLAFSFEK